MRLTDASTAIATIDAGTLHLTEAFTCLAIGAAVAIVRFSRRAGLRLGATPVGAMAVGLVVVASMGHGVALPLVIALVSLVGALLGHSVARSRRSPVVTSSAIWLLDATIAWFVYLSVPDTEGAVAALGLAVPVAVVTAFAPRTQPSAVLGAEVGALGALLVGALVLGGAGAFAWTNWWGLKLGGAAAALVLLAVAALSPSGRARPSPGPEPARPS